MLPVIFHIRVGGLDLPVYGYGLMLVVAFLAASRWAKSLAGRLGLDGEAFVNAGLLALISGIVGARLSHVLENLPEFLRPDRSLWQNLRSMADISSGGLTYYGGFLLATPVLLWYGRRKRLPLRRSMDIVAPCLMLALGLGRIGCFLNGCCYGHICHLPWAVRFPYHSNAYVDQVDAGLISPPDELVARRLPDGRVVLHPPDAARKDAHLKAVMRSQRALPVHPTQLYTTLYAVLLALLLYAYLTYMPAPGRVFALMLVLEGTARYVMELLRVEPAVAGPFSLSMLIGLGIVIAGTAMWTLCGRMQPAAPGGAPAQRPGSPRAAARTSQK